jgi:ABC-type spermidine/putrescine transport system permease subunit II
MVWYKQILLACVLSLIVAPLCVLAVYSITEAKPPTYNPPKVTVYEGQIDLETGNFTMKMRVE